LVRSTTGRAPAWRRSQACCGSASELRVGQRVAYAGALGAYASERNLPAARAIALPDLLADRDAATLLARGITAFMLETTVYDVRATSTILVHSAAGGLGNLLVRWAKQRGATVIATVGSAAKAAIARTAGADHVIVGRDADFAARVLELTDDRGVEVAYDGVGGTTLANNFACVRPFGMVVSIGQAAGPIPPIAVSDLSKRSLSLSRPSVMAFMADPARYRQAAQAVLASGLVSSPTTSYALADAARAHVDLEAGAYTGTAVLIP
jgi:NADPH:quinone reductase